MKKILRIILYAVALLIALEVSLYILGIPKSYRGWTGGITYRATLNPATGYTQEPNSNSYAFYDGDPRDYFAGPAIVYAINSRGYRGGEFELKKQPGTKRFLFLGDSIVFGFGVYFRDTFGEQFRKLAETSGIFGEKVVAVNMGVVGYNTSQEYATLLEQYKDGLEFDQAIVGYFFNDADKPLFKMDENGAVLGADGRMIPDGFDDLLNYYVDNHVAVPLMPRLSRIARIIWQANERREISSRTIEHYHQVYAEDSPTWQKTKHAIGDFGEFQKKTGIPVTFVLFPVLYNLEDPPFAAERAKVKAELEKNGISYIDLLPVFAPYEPEELWVHPTDQHPNETGHRLAAEALIEYFKIHSND